MTREQQYTHLLLSGFQYLQPDDPDIYGVVVLVSPLEMMPTGYHRMAKLSGGTWIRSVWPWHPTDHWPDISPHDFGLSYVPQEITEWLMHRPN